MDRSMWVRTLDISASVALCTNRCMQQPRSPMLLPSGRPSPCFLRRCHADARHGSDLFPGRPLHPRRDSSRRSPKPKSHAQLARGEFHLLCIHRQAYDSNSAPLFSSPASFFHPPALPLFRVTRKHNRHRAWEA
jgi:hypothetical protein